MKLTQSAQFVASTTAQPPMSMESYLNHPTFGLLYRVCDLEETKELFATLYAQRLFFRVTTDAMGVQFEPTSRADAKMLIENRLRGLRRFGDTDAYNSLIVVYKQTFQ